MPNWLSFYAKKTYLNLINDKIKWKKDNKNKSGIYCLLNLKNKKIYIGKSNNLNKRISAYLSLWQYNNSNNSLILKSILKHGLDNFALIILEYTKQNDLVYLCKREQYWINILRPQYNIILKVDPYTRSTLRSKEYKHTELVKTKLREIANNRTKLHKSRIPILVKDIITGNFKKYRSIREAARDLNCDTRTIRLRTLTKNITNLQLRRNNNNIDILRSKLIRKRYLIIMDKNP